MITATDHYVHRQTLARTVSDRAAELWGQVDPGDIAASWARQLPETFHLVSAAQLAAATPADEYVAGYVGDGKGLAGAVNPRAFAGIASDGRPLPSLLSQPVFVAKHHIAVGVPLDEAMGRAAHSLARIVATQVQDAGRVADGVAITAREGVGYVREVRGAAPCSRCIVLAGAWYRWNDGFDRHPNCACEHVPAVDGAVKFNERDYFESLSAKEQDRVFTKAGAQAIRDGADINKVVNARRGMTPAGTTWEATTTRSRTGRRLAEMADVGFEDLDDRVGRYRRVTEAPRLMPEQIYREAQSRGDALDALYMHGYLEP